MFIYPIETYVILSYMFAVYFILYGVSHRISLLRTVS